MNSHTLGIVLAVVSAVSLGISNSLYKQSSEVLSPVQTTFYYYLFSALLATVVWFFYGESKPVSVTNLVWPAAIAVFLFLSVLSFNLAIVHLSVSMGATIRALSFLVTVMIGVCWYRDQVTWQQGLAVVLSLVSILLVGLSNSSAE
jgi:drug/metabolite transporter (DMT)-like permease